MQKIKRWRSERYLKWVRSRHCCMCNYSPCDAHHIIGLGLGLSGMGMTAPDSYTMPLCRIHHTEVHRSSEFKSMQLEWLEKTLEAACVEMQDSKIITEINSALDFVRNKIDEIL